MKQIVCSFIVFLCFSPALLRAQLPFVEDFESGSLSTNSWVVSGGAQISTYLPASGFYCLEGPATWGVQQIMPNLAAGIMTVEFRARAGQDSTICLIFRMKDDAGNTSAGIYFYNDGSIMGVNGSGNNVMLQNYVVNEWHLIQFVIDHVAMTYDVFIDNTLVADDFVFFSPVFTGPYLFSWSCVAQTGSVWLDNVSILSGTTSGGLASPAQNTVSLYSGSEPGTIRVKTPGSGNYGLKVNGVNGSLIHESFPVSGECQITIAAHQEQMIIAELWDESGGIVARKKLFIR